MSEHHQWTAAAATCVAEGANELSVSFFPFKDVLLFPHQVIFFQAWLLHANSSMDFPLEVLTMCVRMWGDFLGYVRCSVQVF